MLHIFFLLIGLYVMLGLTKSWNKRRAYRQAIDAIPGPPNKPIIGAFLNFLATPENTWKCFRSLAAQHRSIYKHWWFEVPIINLLNPEDIEIILSTTKHSSKSIVYNCLHPWLKSGLLTSKGVKWQERRKMLTPAFHFTILQQFLGIFVEHSQLLVQELDKECGKLQTNIVPFVAEFALHAVCETAMGIKLKRDELKTQRYTQSVYRMGEILMHRITRPWLFFDSVFSWFPTYKEQTECLNVLHSFSKSIIEERKLAFNEPELMELEKKENFASKSRHLAMLDLLISAKNSGHPIDDEGIREEVDTFIFEGHDTTTACISFTLLLLANHEDIQNKVTLELENIFGDSERTPTFQDLQQMRYLELVLKESLRLYPSVPLISREVEEEVRTHTGYTIPPGSVVHIHIYDLHRNPNLYPDPEKFDPDRFLPENTQNRHPFAYLPFSAGPRNCIGQKFAFMEIKVAIAAILRKFVLKPVDSPAGIVLVTNMALKSRNGIRIKLEKRVK